MKDYISRFHLLRWATNIFQVQVNLTMNDYWISLMMEDSFLLPLNFLIEIEILFLSKLLSDKYCTFLVQEIIYCLFWIILIIELVNVVYGLIENFFVYFPGSVLTEYVPGPGQHLSAVFFPFIYIYLNILFHNHA